MKNKRFLSLLSLLLVLAMLFVGCAQSNPQEKPNGSDPTECDHAETTLKNVLEATCTTEGYTGDVVCVKCEAVVTPGTKTSFGHKWNQGEVTKTPTCIETGLRTFTCTSCGTTMTEAIATVAHVDVYHDALDGTHNHTCTMCTKSENEAHTPVDANGTRVEATCLEPAYTEYECSLCQQKYKVYSEAEEDQEKGHTYGEWEHVLDASCSTEGQKKHTCTECDFSETITIPVASSLHSFTLVDVMNSTCVTAGTAIYACTECGHSESRELPLGAHELSTNTGDDGWTHSTCYRCDYTVSSFDASDVKQAVIDSTKLNTESAFEITTQDATLEFPKEVVQQMTNGKDSVKIDAGVLADTAKQDAINAATNLTEDQKNRLADVEIFNFEVDTVDGNFSAKVNVKIPYTLKAGEEADGIVIWFVDKDGTVKSIPATYADGFVTFEAEHFSYYAVAYEETQEMQCRRGKHDFDPTDAVIPATCETYGYTVYECSCCHATDVRDFVEKLSHSYGEMIAPTVTCDQGGYYHKICANCGDIKNFTYVRAKGHTIEKRATCTEHAICSTCNHVAEFARGHAFGEWTTILEPTDVNAGLRRRTCSSCGTVEEVKIAATGNIEQYNFSGYQEMMEYILSDILHFENGTVTFEQTDVDGDKVSMDVTIEKMDTTYFMLMKVKENYTVRVSNGITVDEKGNINESFTEQKVEDNRTFLYRDGVLVAIGEDEKQSAITGIDMMESSMPFDIFMDYLEQSFNYRAPKLEASFEDIESLLNILDLFAAPEVNEALKEMGFDMTLSDLSDAFHKLKVLYVYNAQKLGFTTSIELTEEVPTALDLLKILGDYTTVSEGTAGQKVYTFDFDQVMDALEYVYDWATDNAEKSLAEVLYTELADDIADFYPEAKSWDDLIAALKKEYTPNMKIGEALDRIVSILEKRGVVTVEDAYALVESLVLHATGQEISIKDFFESEDGDMTLNEYVQNVLNCRNMDEFWTQIDEAAKSLKIKDIELDGHWEERHDPEFGYSSVYVPYLVSDWLVDVKDVLDNFTQSTDFTLTVDQRGYLISLDTKGTYSYGEEGTVSYKLTIERDDSVKVTVTPEQEALLGVKITKTFAENGDLIVTVPEGYDFEIQLPGSTNVNLEHLIQRDDLLSEELGLDVYVLKKEFWTYTTYVGEFVEMSGKYYSYNYSSVRVPAELKNPTSLADLQKDWTVILPKDGDVANGVLEKSQTPVYESVIGKPIYQDENGDWMIAMDCHKSYYSTENGAYYQYYVTRSVKAADVLTEIRISNDGYYYGDVSEGILDGKKIKVTPMFLSVKGMDETLPALTYINENSEIILVATNGQTYKSVYVLSDPMDQLPAHDRIEDGRDSSSMEFVDANGNPVDNTLVKRVFLYKFVPQYYVKVDDGKFVSYGSGDSIFNPDNGFIDYYYEGLHDSVNTDGMETITLPSGKIMYVKGTWGDDISYGYTKISENLYVDTACYFDEEGALIKVIYRNEKTEQYMSYSKLADLNKYVVKNGNTITIDAELFALLKKYCTRENSYAYIAAVAGKETDDMAYQVMHHVYTYFVKAENLFGTVDSIITESPNWYEWFDHGSGSSSNNPTFTVTMNEDGTVTVTTDKKTIDVRYDWHDWEFPVTDGMVELDTEKTEEHGLDVYKAPTLEEFTYILKDGKYYTFTTSSVLDYSYVTDIKTLITEYWRIGSLSYSHDANVDGTILPVYTTSVSIANNYIGRFYMTIQDGKLFVLTGISWDSSALIQFEELVPINEYFQKISETVVLDKPADGKGEEYYDKDLNKIQLYYCAYTFTYTGKTADGKDYTDYHSMGVEVVKVGGEDRLITQKNYNKSICELLDEVNVDGANSITFHWTGEYANGEYDLYSVTFIKYNYLVKLLGQYYYLGGEEDEHYGYLNWRVSEDTVKDSFSTYISFYRTEDENGNAIAYYKYAEKGANNSVIVSDTFDESILIDDNISQWYWGTTEDGYRVFECHGRMVDENLTEELLADGSKFICREGETWGYVALKDGYFASAYKVMNRDGEYVVSIDQSPVYLYSETMEDMFNMNITVNENSAIINQGILDLIDEDNEDSVTICFESEYYRAFRVDFEELAGWFELAETQPGTSMTYRYNPENGEYEAA